MNEVKAREDQYDLVKDILAQIRGLPPSIQLAKRERRLLAHGLLQRVTGPCSQGPDSLRPAGEEAPKRNSRLAEAITEWDRGRGRSASVKSTSSSATGVSFKSYETNSSASSSIPTTPSSDCFPSRCRIFPKSNADFAYASISETHGHHDTRSRRALTNSHLDDEAEMRSVHAFVFTDLVLLTSPINSSRAEDDGPKWCLLDGIGLAMVLSVTEIPRTSGAC